MRQKLGADGESLRRGRPWVILRDVRRLQLVVSLWIALAVGLVAIPSRAAGVPLQLSPRAVPGAIGPSADLPVPLISTKVGGETGGETRPRWVHGGRAQATEGGRMTLRPPMPGRGGIRRSDGCSEARSRCWASPAC